MHIYHISDPHNPGWVASYDHATACDPVVVDDHYTYITLRSGTPCNSSVNQLEVVNIQNLTKPFHMATYHMTHPCGLGIDQSILFLYDDGLKVFNATNVQAITDNQLAHFQAIRAHDVIPMSNRILMIIGEDGFYQYDYSQLEQIRLLSMLPVVRRNMVITYLI